MSRLDMASDRALADLALRGLLWVEGKSEDWCPLQEVAPLVETVRATEAYLQQGKDEMGSVLTSVSSQTLAHLEELLDNPSSMSVDNMLEMAAATAEASGRLHDILGRVSRDGASGLAGAALASVLQSSPPHCSGGHERRGAGAG